ncbi:alpha-1,3-mannosyltransferase CMT1 [Plectosphaerella plurivora]|uniref:Alpha-1,3-mannosyltransferase CMT1 n=1 Tax=Plectosphaerella plurivora TaxID=936078 RepID=A0A9P8VKG1_9PEZI|nr:alpha-1,3-mannosyltransferase CMT1 [Plectosphaerella plurivora]
MHRDRRLLILIVPVLCFLLLATGLYLGQDHLSRITKLHIPFLSKGDTNEESKPAPSIAASTSTPTPTPTPPAEAPLSGIKDGAILSAERITPYVAAILDFSTAKGDHLQCPPLNETRYESLKSSESPDITPSIAYFFALDLRNCRALLPRLLSSIVQAARFLGPDNCALSIVEGNSPDGTGDILAALGAHLRAIGMAYHFQTSDINPSKGSRIPKLAALRNLALAPLIDANSTIKATPETTVLFINDVAACAEDLLELALQRRRLGADMTCAMDWTYVGPDPTFYDVWVARGINGDSFFEIPQDGSWDRAWHLFWNDPSSKARLAATRPFQVFSCWNGATAFSAGPLLGPKGIRFRDIREGECGQGEPQIFCKDLWYKGHGKIAVVPSINLEYSNDAGKKVKALKGFTSDLVRLQDPAGDAIDWVGPPENVKCMQGWQNQFWRPWNETLGASVG